MYHRRPHSVPLVIPCESSRPTKTATAQPGFGAGILPPTTAVVESPDRGAPTPGGAPGPTRTGEGACGCTLRSLPDRRLVRAVGSSQHRGESSKCLVSGRNLIMPRSRSLHAAAVLLGLLVVASAASAQTRWVVDSKASLAWWQINPHLHHLWATTCPGEPSWRPGEGRSSGWAINPALPLAETGYGLTDDTIHVPKYPRHRIHQGVCAEAVRGDV